MPFMSGSAAIVRQSVKQVQMADSFINSSYIDMNLKNITSVKDPVNSQDAATKFYVDIRLAQPGVGLTKEGNKLHVLPDQPQIVSLGTLVGLTVSGTTTVPSPVNGTDAATKEYVDSQVSSAVVAGIGLYYTDRNVLNVSPDQPQIRSVGTLDTLSVSGDTTFPLPVTDVNVATKGYVDTTRPTAGVGLEQINTRFDVLPNQPQIVSLGTLNRLEVSGRTIIQDPVDPFDAATKGYVDRSLPTVGNGLVMENNVISVSDDLQLVDVLVSGKLLVPIPIDPMQAANKSYVDDTRPIAGVGLIETSNRFDVDPNQTLNSLTVLGETRVQDPVNDDNPVTKGYLQTSLPVAGSGLLQNGIVLSVDPIQTLFGLTVTGVTTVIDPVNPTDAATKRYVDNSVVVPGTGLIKTGTVLSVDPDQTFQTVTVQQKLTVPEPIDPTDAASMDYVLRNKTIAGTGLLQDGVTLSVDPVLSLSVLTVANRLTVPEPVFDTDAATRHFVLANKTIAGIGLSQTGNVIDVKADQSFDNLAVNYKLTVPVPVDDQDAASKSYVDLHVPSFGPGLILLDGVLSVDPNGQYETLKLTTYPTAPTDVVNKQALDDAVQFVISNDIEAGRGLVQELNVISVDPVQILESVMLTVDPTNPDHAVTKKYVDDSVQFVLNTAVGAGTGIVIDENRLIHVAPVQNLSVLNVSDKISVPYPIDATDAVSKQALDDAVQFVISSDVRAGTGLLQELNVISVDPVQSLRQLTVSEFLTVPVPMNDQHAASKLYVDQNLRQPGDGLLLDDTRMYVNPFLTLQGLIVTTASSFPNPVDPKNAATKEYVDAYAVVPGRGLEKTGNVLSVASDQTLDNLVVTGSITVPSPTADDHAVSRGYVDQFVRSIEIVTAGPGLIKTGTELSVDPHQTLSTLNVTEKLTVPEPVDLSDAVSKSYLLQNLPVAGTGLLQTGQVISVDPVQTLAQLRVTGTLTVSEPVNTSDAASKFYVDSTKPRAGIGLNDVGGTFNVDQDLILRSLVVTESVSVPDPIEDDHAATKRYVNEAIDTSFDARYSGVPIDLVQDVFVNVVEMKPCSLIVCIYPTFDGGPSATFALSKSSDNVHASVFRLTASPGLDSGEMLEIRWFAGEQVMLRKTGPGHDGRYMVDFNMRNLVTGNFPLPVDEGDVATKGYVDMQIRTVYSTVTFILLGSDMIAVHDLDPGSYEINVWPKLKRGPTASFSVSKSDVSMAGSIFRKTSSPGLTTGEQLLLEWPAYGLLMVRKTGTEYDGEYVIKIL